MFWTATLTKKKKHLNFNLEALGNCDEHFSQFLFTSS